MNLKKTISLLLSAVLAAGSLIAAPVLPEGTALFSTPIIAEAAGTVSSGTTTSTPSEPLISCKIGTSTLYFKKPTSGTQVKICGSKLDPNDTYLTVPKSFSHNNVTYSITGIAAGAFKNQTILKSFTFDAAELASIDSQAFKGCTNLIEWFGKSGTGKCAVRTIGNNAFENCTEMNCCAAINDAIEIGYNAFKNCIKLRNVTLSRIELLRGSAFYGCKGLQSVEFGLAASVPSIEYRTFADCTNLESISLPETVWLIEENAFSNCSSMEKVYIPDSVKEIHGNAFYNCRQLKTVMMSENIRFIANYAFYNCNAMKYFVCKNTNATIGSYAVGYHKENNTNVQNSGRKDEYETGNKKFIIWGCGGNVRNYAVQNGFDYKDINTASSYAISRYNAYEWRFSNISEHWSKDGYLYFNNAHQPYENGHAGKEFIGICAGLSIVSALTSSGYLKVSDYAPSTPKLLKLRSISTITNDIMSYATTVYAHQGHIVDYSIRNEPDKSPVFDKEFLRYAEYITYGADVGVISEKMSGNAIGHSVVCFGMEFKKNASDINSNTDWNGMDARLLIYDPNTSEYTSGRNIYVNLASGNWKWKGGLIFENYDPSKCNFTLTHSYDKMIEPGHTMTTSEFFEAIRNPQ